jgi:ATP-binding protein involved in chromosome partitioning
MPAPLDRDTILKALRSVTDPDLRKDIVTLGFVKDLAVGEGKVSFTIELTTPACPVKDQMREQAAAAVRALGVNDVDVLMTAKVRSVSAPEKGHPPHPGVKNVIAVGAGKGGVGKTTVAVNLALALAKCGSKVGILDADVYGPNVPMMLGLHATQLITDGKSIVPAEKYGAQVVSMAFLTQDDQAIVWRGPMLHAAIRQFFQDVAWKDLDYLIVDMPPGTGDVALSLSQVVPVVGAIVVTTPQQVSLADSRRAIRMYQKLNIPPMGIVENMSYYSCTNCHHEADIFGHGGGEALAGEMSVPFLGRLPVYQPIREGSDSGVPLVVGDPAAPASRAFLTLAERVAAQVSIAAHRSAEANKGKIPLIQVR